MERAKVRSHMLSSKRDITGKTLGSSLYSIWLKTFKTICCGLRCIFPKSFPIDSAHQETVARFTLPSTSFYFADWIASKSHFILETISTWPLKGIICVSEEGMSHRFLIWSDIELSLSIRPETWTVGYSTSETSSLLWNGMTRSCLLSFPTGSPKKSQHPGKQVCQNPYALEMDPECENNTAMQYSDVPFV